MRSKRIDADERARRGTAADQPRGYWVSFMQNGRRMLDDRPYLFVSLDMTPGVAMEETRQALDALLRLCIDAANVRKADIPHCYLELRAFSDVAPGVGPADFQWAATWEPE